MGFHFNFEYQNISVVMIPIRTATWDTTCHWKKQNSIVPEVFPVQHMKQNRVDVKNCNSLSYQITVFIIISDQCHLKAFLKRSTYLNLQSGVKPT